VPLSSLCASKHTPANPAIPLETANWAQFGGLKAQNAATSSKTPWTGRWGHALAVFENRQTAGDPLPLSLRTRIFVLGGETFSPIDGANGEYGGVGMYMNDVWTSLNMGTAQPSDWSRCIAGMPMTVC
jgi:hypothetical protein